MISPVRAKVRSLAQFRHARRDRSRRYVREIRLHINAESRLTDRYGDGAHRLAREFSPKYAPIAAVRGFFACGEIHAHIHVRFTMKNLPSVRIIEWLPKKNQALECCSRKILQLRNCSLAQERDVLIYTYK